MTTAVRKVAEQLEADGALGGQRHPVIEITTDVPAVVDALESAIVAHPERLLYQREGRIVRIVRGADLPTGVARPADLPTITQAPVDHIAEVASRVASWLAYDGRSKRTKAARPPTWAVRTFAARGSWSLSVLTDIVEAPTLRPDGSVLERPGYDTSTGILLATAEAFPAVPASPSFGDACHALAELAEVHGEFPFVEESDRAAALAALLTLLARPAIPGPVPLFLVRATAPGSGKSLLVDTLAIIATGHPAPRIPQATSEDEERKRLLALALEGDRVVLVDNVTRPLGSGALDAVLTAGEVKDRLLGVSETARAPWHAVLFATGNNMQVAADTGRRAVPIDLDAQVERPDERTGFRHAPLLQWVRRERPRLVVAGLTALRGYIAAGRPKQSIPEFGSFEAWSDLIRGALVWCGMPDPAAGRDRIRRDSDPVIGALGVVLDLWRRRYGDAGETVGGALRGLATDDPLHDALVALAPPRNGKGLESQLVGSAFRRHKGRIVGGLRLQSVAVSNGSTRWATLEGGHGGDSGLVPATLNNMSLPFVTRS